MQETDPELRFAVIRAIKDIPEQDWDSLFDKDLIEGYGYQKTLEESGTKEFSFAYLTAKRKGRTVLILPFFIMDFSLPMLMPEALHRITAPLKRWLSMKIVFLGSPTTEEFAMGVSADEELAALLDKALEKLREFCRQEKAAGIAFYNLSPKHAGLAGYLKKRGFFKLESLPTTAIEIRAQSLEEYINGLSKNTRKDLKKKLRHSKELAELRTEIREDVTDIIEDVYRLYLNNFDDADVQFETLTREFFLNICRNMPGVAKYFITYDNSGIVAFNLCLIKDSLFIDKFIGFDYAVAHKYHLYYTSFCHNIEWCIKHGIRVYQPGFSDYHPKVRLGAKLIPLDIYGKAYNLLLDMTLKLIKPLIQPKNMDPVLKEIERKNSRLNPEGIS